MDGPLIVSARPKLGQKRCKIELSILLKNGAKLRTKLTFQKDTELDKSMT